MAASAREKPATPSTGPKARRASKNKEVTPEQARLERQRAMGIAIREARIDRNWTQDHVGSLLGNIPQTTISRWEKGKIDFTLEQIYELEVIFSMTTGSLLARAGYSKVEFSSADIIEALRMDDSIHPEFRKRVVDVYRGFVEMTKLIN